MLSAYLKGAAALSAAAILLFGAGSVARADLGAPNPAGVDAQQVSPPSGSGGLGSSTAPSPQQPRQQRPAPAQVQRDDNVVVSPAPPSEATANVLSVKPLDTCVSCTNARAGYRHAHAGARAIRLLGNDISAGDSDGGRHSGALIAIPAPPLLFLAIADWDADADPGATSTSHSRASLVDLVIGPSGTSRTGHSSAVPGGAISVAVLEATSNAGYQGLSSRGSGANNGVDVNIGQGALQIIILHSDASSENKGSAYVLGINGAQILSSEQTGGSGIPVAVPGVINIVLLQVGATGGQGTPGSSGNPTGTGAAVGTVSDLLGQSGQQVGVLTASAVGLAGLQATPNAGTPPATNEAPAAAAAGGAKGLKAPNTGTVLGLGGLLLLASGGGLLGLCLRRRRDEV